MKSDYLNAISNVNNCVAKFESYRALTENEILSLKNNRNQCDDWKMVKAFGDMNCSRIYGNRFMGKVVLGNFTQLNGYDGLKMNAGVSNSTLFNCIVEDEALVADCSLISNTYVGKECVVVGCGSIGKQNGLFGNGLVLSVGVETGGRDIPCYAEMEYEEAVTIGAYRKDIKLQKKYKQRVRDFADKASCGMNVLGEGSLVLFCSQIDSVFLGSYGCCRNSIVKHASILSNRKEKTVIEGQALVSNSIVQWGCHVDSMAIIHDSFMFDNAHASIHAKILGSCIGQNSGISEGECTASFVGPFVGFHHQALLIATFWPEGKGNVGYGANVGSNHTLKAPDQELWPGEGTFFGLGVNIKYPSNFRKAPYSVIATGVMTLGQTVCMPFSLINGAAISIPELSPAINEIMPGWVLASSVFTVLRNEHKFKTRNHSQRINIGFKIFRPEIISLMVNARKVLINAANSAKIFAPSSKMPIYTDKQVVGLGKNYMTEVSRKNAIKAYTFFIKHFVYQEIVDILEEKRCQIDDIVTQLPSFTSTLISEFFEKSAMPELLERAIESYELLPKMAENGKSRDDKRGARIIDDYDDVHTKAGDEKIVILARKRAQEVRFFVEQVLPKAPMSNL